MKTMTDVYNSLQPIDAELEKRAHALLEKQAEMDKEAEEQECAGRITARGFADELNKLAGAGGFLMNQARGFAAQPAANPAANPAAQPAAKPAVQPAAQSAAQPAAKPAAQPAVQPAAQSAKPRGGNTFSGFGDTVKSKGYDTSGGATGPSGNEVATRSSTFSGTKTEAAPDTITIKGKPFATPGGATSSLGRKASAVR